MNYSLKALSLLTVVLLVPVLASAEPLLLAPKAVLKIAPGQLSMQMTSVEDLDFSGTEKLNEKELVKIGEAYTNIDPTQEFTEVTAPKSLLAVIVLKDKKTKKEETVYRRFKASNVLQLTHKNEHQLQLYFVDHMNNTMSVVYSFAGFADAQQFLANLRSFARYELRFNDFHAIESLGHNVEGGLLYRVHANEHDTGVVINYSL